MSSKVELSRHLLKAASDPEGLTMEETLRVGQEHGLTKAQSAALFSILKDHYVDSHEKHFLQGKGKWPHFNPGMSALFGTFKRDRTALNLLSGKNGIALFISRYEAIAEGFETDSQADLAEAFMSMARLHEDVFLNPEKDSDDAGWQRSFLWDQFSELFKNIFTTLQCGEEEEVSAALYLLYQITSRNPHHYKLPRALQLSTAESLIEMIEGATVSELADISWVLQNIFSYDNVPKNLKFNPDPGSEEEAVYDGTPELAWWRLKDQALEALEGAQSRIVNESYLDFGIEDDEELENRSDDIEMLQQVTRHLRVLNSAKPPAF